MSENRMMHIRLPFVLHQHLKARAAFENRTMTSVFIDSLMDYLDKNPPQFPLTAWRELYDRREQEKARQAEESRQKIETARVKMDAREKELQAAKERAKAQAGEIVGRIQASEIEALKGE